VTTSARTRRLIVPISTLGVAMCFIAEATRWSTREDGMRISGSRQSVGDELVDVSVRSPKVLPGGPGCP
jgi:hypothetical protein